MRDGPLESDTALHLAPEVRARCEASRHVLVDSPTGTVVDTGPHGFAILALLSRPTTFGEVVERIDTDAEFATDRVSAVGVVMMLADTGALVTSDPGDAPTIGWADPVEHARMLNDHRRTGDYLAAIRSAVRPGDVVLDVGTGSGVLAVAAVRAGARRVYAIEATDIADVAEGVFARNDVADRVTVIRGWSELVDLPEPADVLVSEVIGSEPLEENLVEMAIDARRRLLRPGARMIPNALVVTARPVLVPDAVAGRHAFGNADVRKWLDTYGIDFGPLLDATAATPVLEPCEGEMVATWPQVGPPVPLIDIDLVTVGSASITATADLAVDPSTTGGCALNAIALTFRADLFETVVHELDPWRWPASSWTTAVWFLPGRLEVGVGEVVRVTYRRLPRGTPALTCEVVPG